MARGLCELVGRLKYWDQQKALTEEPVDAEWLLYLASIIPAMEVSLSVSYRSSLLSCFVSG